MARPCEQRPPSPAGEGEKTYNPGMAILGRPSQADEERAAAWRNWLQRQNPLAIAAFVLGALSFTHGGTLIFDGVASVVLGVVALMHLKRLRVSPAGVVMADAPPERAR